MPDDPPRSLWRQADARHAAIDETDVETLRLILLLVREWHEQSGTWPNPVDVLAVMHHPS